MENSPLPVDETSTLDPTVLDDCAEPLIVRLEDQLIVFRDDEYGVQGPRCVAMTSKRKRCVMTVQTVGSYDGWSEWAVADTGGEIEALEIGGVPADCYIKQRCQQHIESDVPDAVPPTWEMFDPVRHADLIHYPYRATWTPSGLKRIDGTGTEFVPQAPAIDAAADAFYDLLHEARSLRPAPAKATALYRFYDIADRLLYVGITDHLAFRHMRHVEQSSWMEFAVRSTIERFPTRDDAQTAEIRAIETERPLFNSQHADLAAPQRLVEYLIKHGRTDLLAPAVSRG